MKNEPKARGRALDGLAAFALGLAGASLVAMALVQAWQVFARYVLNDSLGWTEPVALLLMGLAVMLGAAVGVRKETHFAFQGLRDALPGPLKAAAKSVTRLIALATGLGLLGYGVLLAADDWSVPMAGAPLPSGLRWMGLAIGGGLIALFAAERLVVGDPVEPGAEG